MINKEELRIFYFIETIDKMYFLPDDSSPVRFEIYLHIDDKNPKNPRIVELFYFPYKKFDFGNLFENLYHTKRHYSSFEMENDGKIYEIIDKSSKEQLAQKIISFVDKDLEKARETAYRNIKTLLNIYAQTLKGLENMIKVAEKGKDLHIFKKLWEAESLTETDFDLEKFKGYLNYLINKLLPALHKLTKLISEIKEIAEYTILYEKHKKHKKLYIIKVRFVGNYKNKNRYAYYNILIEDDKIKVGIEVEYDVSKVVEEIYKRDELVVLPFGWPEWLIGARYREKATKSWYYFLRPTP